jgi:hypothetical protein
MVVRSYERFLELPVPLVLVAMWLAGLAPAGLCVMLAYVAW